MSEPKALQVGTIVAAAAASVAALAGSVQSYIAIAWSGRNDALKASLVAAAVEHCSEVSTTARSYSARYSLAVMQMEEAQLAAEQLIRKTLIR